MSKMHKPAALHYAAILDDFYMGLGRLDATGAAAELRRLHATNETLLKALEEAKVLIGAGNDSLSEAARQSNVNVAWHKLDAAASQAPAVGAEPAWTFDGKPEDVHHDTFASDALCATCGSLWGSHIGALCPAEDGRTFQPARISDVPVQPMGEQP